MLARINHFFSQTMQLHSRDENQRTQSIEMAVAALLIEVSRADHELSEGEKKAIKSLLTRQFNLANKDLDALFELAENQVEEAVSLYQFTQLVNQTYQHDDKLALIEAMWKVAFADGEIDKYEDHLIRKVAELVYVGHSDFIKLKLNVAQQLGIDADSVTK